MHRVKISSQFLRISNNPKEKNAIKNIPTNHINYKIIINLR